jgi:hypothetical protein
MLPPMEEMQDEKPQDRKLDARKIAVIGVGAAVLVALAAAGWFGWRGHKQKQDETAIVAAVTDTTMVLREVLAKPVADAAPRIDGHLSMIKAASRTPLSDAAEEYVLGAREIARKKSDSLRLGRQATASREAALAHLAAGQRRGDGWFKTAASLKKRMESDYFELNTSLKTLDTLLAGMPESVKRAGPLLGDSRLLPASEFNAASARAQEDLKRVALELERARQLPLN